VSEQDLVAHINAKTEMLLYQITDAPCTNGTPPSRSVGMAMTGGSVWVHLGLFGSQVQTDPLLRSRPGPLSKCSREPHDFPINAETTRITED